MSGLLSLRLVQHCYLLLSLWYKDKYFCILRRNDSAIKLKNTRKYKIMGFNDVLSKGDWGMKVVAKSFCPPQFTTIIFSKYTEDWYNINMRYQWNPKNMLPKHRVGTAAFILRKYKLLLKNKFHKCNYSYLYFSFHTIYVP